MIFKTIFCWGFLMFASFMVTLTPSVAKASFAGGFAGAMVGSLLMGGSNSVDDRFVKICWVKGYSHKRIVRENSATSKKNFSHYSKRQKWIFWLSICLGAATIIILAVTCCETFLGGLGIGFILAFIMVCLMLSLVTLSDFLGERYKEDKDFYEYYDTRLQDCVEGKVVRGES